MSVAPEVPLASIAIHQPSRVLAWLAHRPVATLGLLFLLLWTPGVLSLPPLDRDESRFAESSRQMLASGDFVDIRFGHVPRYKKPIGIYWLQAATTAIAGAGNRSHIWTYRLPSLLGGILAVLLTYWCTSAFASAGEAWLAAALLGLSLLLTAEATIATTDAVQLACMLGTIGTMLRAYLAGRGRGVAPSLGLALAGWASLAAGILVKGPVVPAVAVVTILALVIWDREWRWLSLLRPLWGVPVAIALVAPWAVAILLTSHGQFYQQSFGQDFAEKLAGGQETHGAWPGYYLLLLTVSFWPAILFLAPALGIAIRKRSDPAMRFLLAWCGASWVMFELVPTKLPHYVLPLYPALAIISAAWILAPRDPAVPRWQTALAYLASAQFAVGLAALIAAMMVLPGLYGTGAPWWLAAAAGMAGLFGMGAVVAQLRRASIAAAGLALAAVLVIYPALAIGTAPRLDKLWVSQRAAELVGKSTRPDDPPPALAGYEEPSMVFYLGKDTRLTNGSGAAEVGAAQGGLAVIEDSARPAFMAHLADVDANAIKLDEVSGYNYSKGRPVHITIYRVTPTHDITEPPSE
ncbi:MAG TPA: glycosyltransferase family 39 protein [Rhizomicrobium sp.]|jgi:4-amino-4-deoxy-L-arabinose transferase-like glycosyltransferase|nr:glycosyltransferase family 39 protein [Rhizomicrobium sp.]